MSPRLGTSALAEPGLPGWAGRGFCPVRLGQRSESRAGSRATRPGIGTSATCRKWFGTVGLEYNRHCVVVQGRGRGPLANFHRSCNLDLVNKLISTVPVVTTESTLHNVSTLLSGSTE